ncbi:hypothetical protein Glove_229g133 [Diversispora epigaea]|uniref:Uncharacterized protein n=1 Tax=Diversispora epigaea TaxID=1348612 RepID=A0A397IDK9_9GLOM|nr:hypothetical protein Glove_229g133 [Diversispora epigaea]
MYAAKSERNNLGKETKDADKKKTTIEKGLDIDSLEISLQENNEEETIRDNKKRYSNDDNPINLQLFLSFFKSFPRSIVLNYLLKINTIIELLILTKVSDFLVQFFLQNIFDEKW